MTRTRASAKAAGSRFERAVADYLRDVVDDRIDRRVKTGSSDRGDIGGIRVHGQRVVAECKDTARVNLAGWAAEAEIERGNDDALVGVVISKRHGKGDPAEQWVHMTLADFAALLTGERPGDVEAPEWDGVDHVGLVDSDEKYEREAVPTCEKRPRPVPAAGAADTEEARETA